MRYLMGALCEITAYPPGPNAEDQTAAALDAAFSELKRIDALLSNWKPDSELMRLNAAAGSSSGTDGQRPAVTVSPELFARLEMALRFARLSGGRFDPTVGPLVRAWGFLPAQETGRAAVQAARQRVGWEKVRLDAEKRTVQFAVPGMEIDLGGMAKGYAAERAATVLRQHGITAGLVSLGGSSMTAIGHPAGAAGWPVLVRDPRDGETPAAVLELHDGESLATSGTYEKTVGAGPARRSHILDPHSGEALAGEMSVTLVMRDGEAADALAKFFFFVPGLGSPESTNLLGNYPQASVMLLRLRGRDLVEERAGAQPRRFRYYPGKLATHAAKTH